MSGWGVLTCSSMAMPMFSNFGVNDMFNPTSFNYSQNSGKYIIFL